MKTQTIQDIQVQVDAMIAAARAKGEALIAEAQAAESTYARIAVVEAKMGYYQRELATLKASLPKASGVKPVVKDKNQGVRPLVRDLMLQGYGNKEVLDRIHEHFGNTNTTKQNIYWYRNDFRKNEGLDV
jgi:hypothetical protein